MSITPQHITKQLAAALPTQLQSVVLYGSAAAGDFLPGESNYNLLVVVESLTIAELDALRVPLAAWSRAGHPTPLLFTPEQLIDSADAFPIEFLDMRQSRHVLWGHDPLAELHIRPVDLRLQVERELTGKLLKLRGRYALEAAAPDGAMRLMLRSLSTFLVLIRAALRLFDEVVPEKKIDALHALARHIPFDVRPFERLLALKQRPALVRQGDTSVSFTEYLTAIENVAHAVHSHTVTNRSQT